MQPISRRRFLAGAAASRLFAQRDTIFSSDVNVVNVFATVRNKQGQIVRDLHKEDFSLDEEGRPQIIRYFSQESDLPLTLGLLIDTSFSQRRVLNQERSSAHSFLKKVLREDKDKAFVIHFDHEVELLQDLTSSRKKLEAALRDVELPQLPQRGGYPPGGGRYPRGGGRQPSGRGGRGAGTTLYDAVLLASDELMKKQKGRKALIVLSDGVDNGSQVSLGKGIEAAQRADTLAYSILFSDAQAYGSVRVGGRMGNSPSEFGKDVLQRLSRETGGGFFEVSKSLPIEKVFEQIEEELRHQYSLGYTSDRTEAGPGFRIIHLIAKDPSLIVQSRSGYYAVAPPRPAPTSEPRP
jgi:VWFA-related protein